MSRIDLPEDLSILRQDFGFNDYGLTFPGSDTGATQSIQRAPSRHVSSLVGNERETPEDAAVWRALIYSLRGKVNQLAVYNTVQPEPRGDARGNWTAAGAAAGQATMAINLGAGQAGRTLLVGDLFGVGQATMGPAHQLLHVQADAVANGAGVITVTFEPVLRVAVGAGAPVAWLRPTCLMRRTTESTTWGMHPGELVGGFSLDLLESWE